ncbi:hypothetical protein D9M69_565580 [compost metagenome]
MTLSNNFHARRHELLAATFATVGFGNNGRDSIAGLNEASEGSEAKFLSPKEYESL